MIVLRLSPREIAHVHGHFATATHHLSLPNTVSAKEGIFHVNALIDTLELLAMKISVKNFKRTAPLKKIATERVILVTQTPACMGIALLPQKEYNACVKLDT